MILPLEDCAVSVKYNISGLYWNNTESCKYISNISKETNYCSMFKDNVEGI